MVVLDVLIIYFSEKKTQTKTPHILWIKNNIGFSKKF